MAKGGKRPGAGRPKGSTNLPRFPDYVTEEERRKFAEFVIDQYMGDIRLAVYFGQNAFAKPVEHVDHTTNGETLPTHCMYQETTATRKVAALSKRIRAVQGGTSASKTVSILIYLIALAQTDKTPTLTSIVAESFPQLRRGAMRDFLLILQTYGYFNDALWDKTNSVYTFETGSQIEFFSVDQPEKVRGARRDRLFINECNNTGFEAFEELEVRTKEFIFLDWNPTIEFWFYDHVLGKRDDVYPLAHCSSRVSSKFTPHNSNTEGGLATVIVSRKIHEMRCG